MAELMKHYGQHLILDIHHCNIEHFNRKGLKRFYKLLCNLIDMEREKLVFWDYFWSPLAKRKAPAHLKGTSAVQFISTSTVVIHTLEDLRRVYLDVFSCKEYDAELVIGLAEAYFQGTVVNQTSIQRY